MRRRVLSVTTAAILAGVVGAASTAGIAPGSAAAGTPAVGSPAVGSPAVGSPAGAGSAPRHGWADRDDNDTVCMAAAQTVEDGLDQFATDMDAVSTQAGQGDLVAAEESVRQAGGHLVALSEGLIADAAQADDPKLKSAIEDLAAEFERLGKSLDDLTSLQNFDTTQLDQAAGRMSEFCGGSATPGQSTPGRSTPGRSTPGQSTPRQTPKATTSGPVPDLPIPTTARQTG